MQRLLAAAVLFLSLSCSADASRMLYTAEMAENASLIAVWYKDDIDRSQPNELRLKRPSITLKGDFREIKEDEKYSPRLKEAIEVIANGRPLMLFLMPGYWLDTVGDGGAVAYDYVNLKVTRDVIAQLEIRDRWKSLPISEQIERSDLIVGGTIAVDGPTYPQTFSALPTTIYRGVVPKRASVLRPASGQVSVQSLLFLQRYYGSGPDHMLMHSVPLADAGPYLKLLSRVTLQPEKQPDAATPK